MPSRTIALIAGALLILAALGVGTTFSLADTRDDITFYHLSDDAATHSDSLRDTLEDRYPGTFTDTAHVGDHTFDVSNEFNENEYCAVEPEVRHNGDRIDDYGIDNQIKRYHDRYEGDQEQVYGDLHVTFANPFYTDPYIHWGTFYGMQGCHGTFNRYELPVDWDAITVDVDVPDQAIAGETVTTEITVTNHWRQLHADAAVELCIDGEFCDTRTADTVIPAGTTRTLDVAYTPEHAGELTADVDGRIGLDLDAFHAEGVSVSCAPDGYHDPRDCDMVQIGDLDDHGVTAVASTREAIFDNDLVLVWLELQWDRVTQWLFGGTPDWAE